MFPYLSSNNLNSAKEFRFLLSFLQNIVIKYVIAQSSSIDFVSYVISIYAHISKMNIIIISSVIIYAQYIYVISITGVDEREHIVEINLKAKNNITSNIHQKQNHSKK